MKVTQKGRGAADNPDNRYTRWQREAAEDGWWNEAEEFTSSLTTELIIDTAKSVISYNHSPDIPFDRSINPYRGCEHGCSYCFARPSHAYLGLSPGLDFETKLAYKPDAVEVLRRELAHPKYACKPIALGINTDGWQPVERRLRLTRGILETLAACRHPVSIVTKSALILRDLDILAEMAKQHLVRVAMSITTLNADLARRMEPRAASSQRRLSVLEALSAAGIPTAVLVAPLIPALTDHELEDILHAAFDAGARTAGYVLLRLPCEVKPLFRNWLEREEPGRAEHVFSLLRQMHGGKEYDSRFGHRHRGDGPLAEMIQQRFKIATRRLGFNQPLPAFDCTLFQPPSVETLNVTIDAAQLSLF
ncbi:MAG: PA0069 family radical SAM protein [Rugosibacter sp.]|nr:PA0069 family radical SAM protein [Rugosibacter sp.]